MGGPAKEKKSNRQGLVNFMGQVELKFQEKLLNIKIFEVQASKHVCILVKIGELFL